MSYLYSKLPETGVSPHIGTGGYHKPSVIPRKLDEEKQRAFIESYDNLLNSLAD